VSFSRSGSGGVTGGLSMSKEGAKSDASAPTVVVQLNSPTDTSEQSEGASEALEDATDDQLQEEIAAREQESFDELQRLLEASMREKEELEDASNQVRIEMTEEGMRIEIVDQEDGSMFGAGNAKMSEKTKLVLGEIAKFIKKVPNDISITGHTDAGLFVRSDGYSNWELSSDRANTTRRVLQAAGVPPERMARIIGRADQDPLTPEDPFLPENRRISILLLRQASVLPPSLNKDRN
jgi:chemotaxis protein MotB